MSFEYDTRKLRRSPSFSNEVFKSIINFLQHRLTKQARVVFHDFVHVLVTQLPTFSHTCCYTYVMLSADIGYQRHRQCRPSMAPGRRVVELFLKRSSREHRHESTQFEAATATLRRLFVAFVDEECEVLYGRFCWCSRWWYGHRV